MKAAPHDSDMKTNLAHLDKLIPIKKSYKQMRINKQTSGSMGGLNNG
jgi:hypothetical protein